MACPLYMLDTNICVFFMRGNSSVIKKIRDIGIQNCCISEMTVAELLFGAVWSGSTANKALTKDFCQSIQVIPISESLMEFAVRKSRLRHEGKLIDDFDLMIGASAMANDCILVTDNTKHFDRLPLKLENWIKR